MLVIIGLHQEEKNKFEQVFLRVERNFRHYRIQFSEFPLKKGKRKKATNFKQKLFFFLPFPSFPPFLPPDVPSSLLLPTVHGY